MPALKVSRVAGTGSIAPGLKVSRLGATGTAPSTPALKISRLGGVGTAAVLLNPIAAQTVEPGVLVTLTAVLTGGGSADSYTWRVASGDTVTLDTSTPGQARFISPSVMDAFRAPRQGVTTIGVTATLGGITTPERLVTVTTLPQLSWVLNGSGQWVGRGRTIL